MMGGHAPTPSEEERIARGEKVYEDQAWAVCGECGGGGEDRNGFICLNCRGVGEIPIKCDGTDGTCDNNAIGKAPVRTCYHWDGKGVDPNTQTPFLCEECMGAYNAYWDDMWSEVPTLGGY